jgi:hypothetical protein
MAARQISGDYVSDSWHCNVIKSQVSQAEWGNRIQAAQHQNTDDQQKVALGSRGSRISLAHLVIFARRIKKRSMTFSVIDR